MALLLDMGSRNDSQYFHGFQHLARLFQPFKFSSSPAAPAASMPNFGPPPPTGTQPCSSTLPTTTSKAASPATSFFVLAASPIGAKSSQQPASSTLARRLAGGHGDASATPYIGPDCCTSVVASPGDRRHLQQTLFDPSRDNARLMMAQPAWNARMQQQPTMPTVVESQHSQDESDAASFWSPPDGYQPSTSTQRKADAAHDAMQDRFYSS